MNSNCFSTLEIDAIGEILNISLGASATAVSTMLDARVDITTPIVKVITKEQFEMDKIEPAVGVEITYVSGLEGKNIMLLKRHDVKVIVEMLMGMEMSDEEFELNEMNISAVCEVMNQMMGASSTALSEFLEKVVNISTPTAFEANDEEKFLEKYFPEDEPKVVAEFTLKIADRLESEFYNMMPISLAKELVRGFLPEEAIMDIEAAAEPQEAPAEAPVSSGGVMSQEEIEKLLNGGMDAEPEAEAPASSGGVMSQEEIEKLLNGGMGAEPEAEAPASSGGVMSQEEIEKMLNGGMDAQQPQMQSQPQMQAQAQPQMQTMPQMQAQPQMQMQQQMMMGADASMFQMQQQMMQQMMQQMQQQMQTMQQQLDEAKKRQPPEPKMINVQTAPRPNLSADKDIALAGAQEENMELIMGVPLEISVEIGRTKKFVKDILDFTKGSLVVLDKIAGEQVDLFVNGQCIAKGDVVVVEDNFGIRITEIMKINMATLE